MAAFGRRRIHRRPISSGWRLVSPLLRIRLLRQRSYADHVSPEPINEKEQRVSNQPGGLQPKATLDICAVQDICPMLANQGANRGYSKHKSDQSGNFDFHGKPP
jgi:hypothetical protein